MSLLEALGHLKSSEWSGWRALEPRLQPRTRRWFSRQDPPQQDSLSSTETRVLIRQAGGHGVKPAAPRPPRYRWASLSVCFTLSLWGSNTEGRMYMYIQERMGGSTVIFNVCRFYKHVRSLIKTLFKLDFVWEMQFKAKQMSVLMAFRAKFKYDWFSLAFCEVHHCIPTWELKYQKWRWTLNPKEPQKSWVLCISLGFGNWINCKFLREFTPLKCNISYQADCFAVLQQQFCTLGSGKRLHFFSLSHLIFNATFINS